MAALFGIGNCSRQQRCERAGVYSNGYKRRCVRDRVAFAERKRRLQQRASAERRAWLRVAPHCARFGKARNPDVQRRPCGRVSAEPLCRKVGGTLGEQGAEGGLAHSAAEFCPPISYLLTNIAHHGRNCQRYFPKSAWNGALLLDCAQICHFASNHVGGHDYDQWMRRREPCEEIIVLRSLAIQNERIRTARRWLVPPR